MDLSINMLISKHVFSTAVDFILVFCFQAGQTVLAEGQSGTRAWGWHTLTLTVKVWSISISLFECEMSTLYFVINWCHAFFLGWICIRNAEWIHTMEKCSGIDTQEWLGCNRDTCLRAGTVWQLCCEGRVTLLDCHWCTVYSFACENNLLTLWCHF